MFWNILCKLQLIELFFKIDLGMFFSTLHKSLQIVTSSPVNSKNIPAIAQTVLELSNDRDKKFGGFFLKRHHELWMYWDPVVKVVHDDIDSLIQKRIKNSNLYFIIVIC